MYRFETYSDGEIRAEAEEFVENENLPITSVEDAINIYINAKPGSWRLISHCTIVIPEHPKKDAFVFNLPEMKYQFIWTTGEM